MPKYLFHGFHYPAFNSDVFAIATSDDAINWTVASGTLDPSIYCNAPDAVYYKGQWVLTVAKANDTSVWEYPWYVYTSSTYNGTFTRVATIDWSSKITGLNVCFAPHLFVDDGGSLHAFVPAAPVSHVFTVYETHPTSADLTTWSDPVALSGFPSNTIDARVTKIGSTYYCWYKNETTKYVELATASSLTGTYTPQLTGNFAQFGYGMEGPGMFRISNGWRVHYENYPSVAPGGIGQYYYSDCLDKEVSPTLASTPAAIYDCTQGANPATLYDSSGNAINGTIAGGSWVAAGLAFNGSTTWVDLGNPAGLNFSGSDYTIIACVNPTNGTGYRVIVNKGDGASAAGSQYEIMASTNSDGYYAHDVFIGGSNLHLAESVPHSFDANEWTVIVAQRAGNVQKIYRNGWFSIQATNVGTINSTSNHVAIGSTGAGSLKFVGKMGFVGFWGRTLTLTEIEQTHAYIVDLMADRSITIPSWGKNLLTANWSPRQPWVTPGYMLRHGRVTVNPGNPLLPAIALG